MRKQIVQLLKTGQKLQKLNNQVALNYSSCLKSASSLSTNYNSRQLTSKLQYNFCAEKKEEQKEEKKPEAKKEDLPDDFNKLIEMNTQESISKVKQMYKQLDDKLYNQKKDIENQEKKYKLIEKTNSDLQQKIGDFRKAIQIQEEDMELVRKRLNKEKEEQKVFAISKFAKEMLETSDNLERALDNAKSNKKFDDLFEGTEMTYSILMKSLQKNGVIQVNPFKEKFDPNTMEALMQVDDPKLESGTVAFVIQSGYLIGERCLRPAKVGIVRERSEEQTQAEEEAKKE